MPNVAEVSVFGEPSPITGHIVCARFTLREPEEMAAFRRRVRAFCSGKLAPFKIPAKILVTDASQHSERFKKMRKPTATP
jgi:long-chain acyl-CoA synthetase